MMRRERGVKVRRRELRIQLLLTKSYFEKSLTLTSTDGDGTVVAAAVIFSL